jgi:hypothetical protein
MSKFRKAGRWYVDSKYGYATAPAGLTVYDPTTNPDGWGGPKAPFNTLNLAHTNAASNDKVICTGYFTEVIPSSKTLNWVADGECIVDGSALADGSTFFGSTSLTSCEGFSFRFFQGNSYVFNTNTARSFVNCKFDYCRYGHTVGSGTNRHSLTNCIFNESSFVGAGTSSFIGSIEKCTFTNCSGSLVGSGTQSQFILRNNIFHLCSSLSLGTMPTSRPANSEFNYNNITGALSSNTNAQWQAFGDGSYQANGYAVADSEIFNDYSSGRDDLTYYMNDFTMKPTCILKDADKHGLEIGAKRVGYRISADALWNLYKASSNNLSYSISRGLILLDTTLGTGDYESIEIDLGEVFICSVLNLFANFVYASGIAKEENYNASTEQRISLRYIKIRITLRKDA